METDPKRLAKTCTATRLIFLVCGLGISSWAPMVPYAKDRLALHDAHLGILLLFLGGGALVMMPASGVLASRFGSRIVILVSALVIALTLPLLLILDSGIAMAAALMLFGAGIGSIDVAMNAQAVQVQNLYGRPIMSSLHGLYSVGGLLGALGLGFLIKTGLEPIPAAIGIAVLLIIIAVSQYRYLFSFSEERAVVAQFYSPSAGTATGSRYQWLRGTVLFLGFLSFAVFLGEGAVLDWSAVFLRDNKGVSQEFSGVGYAAFSIAMAFVRLTGDKLVERWNNKLIVVGGSLVAALGFAITVFCTGIYWVLIGYALLGVGAANIVPIFFSDGGKLRGIPPTVSIPVITTLGYAGQLAGPALLGIIAHRFSLEAAFGCLAVLFVWVAIAYFFKR
ncbi:MAG: MFS transporter [Chitinophagaceae bacterium]|nr:MFS transporter [Chitinophagaceae bacterium]MCW5926676.1 MFS transporter [Chitinophagaceae bacterium]